jgi:hypothetical protein
MDRVSAKTRSLKKYEAAPLAVAHEPGDPPLAVFSPFGPLIAQAELDRASIERLNAYADTQIRLDAGSEFLLPDNIVLAGGERSLLRQTESLIGRYLRLMDEPATGKVRIDVFWIVSQYAGTPSPVHFHSGDISGVLYLKEPQLEGEEEELQKTYISRLEGDDGAGVRDTRQNLHLLVDEVPDVGVLVRLTIAKSLRHSGFF